MRGYNQSLLIAKRLHFKSAPVNTDLVRIRNTPAQPTMTSPTQRARNVAGAFAVRDGHNFEGKNICLVDDIKTTGATANECAKTLKQAGAEKVYVLVLAVAGQIPLWLIQLTFPEQKSFLSQKSHKRPSKSFQGISYKPMKTY